MFYILIYNLSAQPINFSKKIFKNSCMFNFNLRVSFYHTFVYKAFDLCILEFLYFKSKDSYCLNLLEEFFFLSIFIQSRNMYCAFTMYQALF